MFWIVSFVLVFMYYIALSEKLKRKPVDRRKTFYARGKCYICEEKWKNEVLASCGHKFCESCAVDSWDEKIQLSCPQCLSPVYTILPKQTKGKIPLSQKVAKYNTSYDRDLIQEFYEFQTIFEYFLMTFSTQSLKENFSIWMISLIGVLYMMLPTDLIDEEGWGLIGTIDDVLITFIGIFIASHLYYNKLKELCKQTLKAQPGKSAIKNKKTN
ncbi:RNF170 [Blepharisma stoltei]|uniref:RING-type domain-containing protein n=1 Tax=Blepharisma stoltei TaxID=1481888 RepID=A0AAU9JW01_9CILI|nr:unnamed protein product [Blepharisma stoltei]